MSSLKGFTLVELMVTIAVAAILLTVGVPSLNSLYETTRAQQNVKKIETLVAFARNQAMSYNQVINLCPSANNGCGADWKAGIQVFILQQQAGGNDNIGQQPQVNRVVLRNLEAFNDKDLIQFNFNQLQFTPDGRVNFLVNGVVNANINTATLNYCPSYSSNEGSQAIRIDSGGATSVVKSGVICSST